MQHAADRHREPVSTLFQGGTHRLSERQGYPFGFVLRRAITITEDTPHSEESTGNAGERRSPLDMNFLDKKRQQCYTISSVVGREFHPRRKAGSLPSPSETGNYAVETT